MGRLGFKPNTFNYRFKVFKCQSVCLYSSSLAENDAKGERRSTILTTGEDEATLYVHWPYCKQICTFCNFNKYVSKYIDHHRMTKCLVREAETLLHLSGVKRINSVYFGGGTPSLAKPYTIFSVLESVSKFCVLPSDAEVTLEANPSSVETNTLRHFHSAGVNRLSLGVQTFNPRDLSLLNRDNTVEDSFIAIETAKGLFPGKVSIDLMFGLPHQTAEMWDWELKQALSVCDNHISLYQLTLEKGTPLYRDMKSGKLSVPDPDTVADMYQMAVKTWAINGFHRYEVANFAKPGAESKHNMSYWNGTQYIGVGPGAHGRFTPRNNGTDVQQARVQTLEPISWMKEVETRGHATRKQAPQTKFEIVQEIFMLSLRTVKGLSNERWQNLSNASISLWDIFGKSKEIQNLIESGFLLLDEKGIRATFKGLSVVDSIVPTLLVHLEQRISKFPLEGLPNKSSKTLSSKVVESIISSSSRL